MRSPAFFTMVALASGVSGCAFECVAAACDDVVHLTLRFPLDEASYAVHVVTEAGGSTCVLRVPLAERGERCADEMIVRWERLDATGARLALFRTASVGLTVESEERVVLGEDIEVQGHEFIPQLDTQEYCGGLEGTAPRLVRDVSLGGAEAALSPRRAHQSR